MKSIPVALSEESWHHRMQVEPNRSKPASNFSQTRTKRISDKVVDPTISDSGVNEQIPNYATAYVQCLNSCSTNSQAPDVPISAENYEPGGTEISR